MEIKPDNVMRGRLEKKRNKVKDGKERLHMQGGKDGVVRDQKKCGDRLMIQNVLHRRKKG